MPNFLCRAAFLLPLLAVPAWAGPIHMETTCGTSVLDGTKTYCDTGLTFDLTVEGPSDILALQVAAPATHCSPVSYLVATPPPPPPPPDTAYAVPATPLSPVEYGHNVLGATGILRAGESEILRLGRGWERGTYPLMVMVIGHVADCNVGQIHSWGVTVTPMIIPE